MKGKIVPALDVFFLKLPNSDILTWTSQNLSSEFTPKPKSNEKHITLN